MSTKLSAGRVRSTYEFIKANRGDYSVPAMCRILGVAPSGYYEWLTHPLSNRAQEDAGLLRLIRASFTASQGIYGAPNAAINRCRGNVGGRRGWRLPTVHELLSLLDGDSPNPNRLPPGHPFTNIQTSTIPTSDSYWSAARVVTEPTSAYVVSFDGFTSGGDALETIGLVALGRAGRTSVGSASAQHQSRLDAEGRRKTALADCAYAVCQ